MPCRNRGCLARCGARGRCGSLTPGAVWTVRCYLRALSAVRAVPAAPSGRSPRGSRHPCRIWPPPPHRWRRIRRPPLSIAARAEPHGLRCAFSRSYAHQRTNRTVSPVRMHKTKEPKSPGASGAFPSPVPYSLPRNTSAFERLYHPITLGTCRVSTPTFPHTAIPRQIWPPMEEGF